MNTFRNQSITFWLFTSNSRNDNCICISKGTYHSAQKNKTDLLFTSKRRNCHNSFYESKNKETLLCTQNSSALKRKSCFRNKHCRRDTCLRMTNRKKRERNSIEFADCSRSFFIMFCIRKETCSGNDHTESSGQVIPIFEAVQPYRSAT